MRWSIILLCAVVTYPPSLVAQSAKHAAGGQPPVPARMLVDSSIAAMGGESILKGLHSLRVDGWQTEYLLGNAERPDGPWRPLVQWFSELRDLAGRRVMRTQATANGSPLAPNAFRPTVLIFTDSVLVSRAANGREAAAGFPSRDDFIDRLDASPERALLLAQSSPGLRLEMPITRYGVPQNVVSLPYGDGRMRLELDRRTRLPNAVEIMRTYPDDFRRGNFGDVTVRFEYSDWGVEPNGFWWPRQHRVFQGIDFLRDTRFSALTLDAPAPPDSFAVSDTGRKLSAAALRATVRTMKAGDRGTLPDVAPGIVRLRDGWTMTAVKQDDGIVLFEAHISAGYLDGVIADVEKRWPGSKVKAIVMTSDPWAHIGGVRQAIARGIPIYVSGLSIPFLKSLAAAKFTIAPDSLAKAPRAPKFVAIDKKIAIGTGANRIELYPVGGPYGEHMTMAYFPERRILYGADLVFPDAPGKPGYFRQGAVDLRRAVAREHLAVDTLFCVQPTVPPIAWSSFVPAGMALP